MVFLVCEFLRVVDPLVLEGGGVEDIVALPTVRIDDAVGHDLALDDRIERRRRGVRDDPRMDPPTALKDAEYRHFPACTPSSLTLALASEIALVHLDLAERHLLRFCFRLVGNDLAKAMKTRRCRLAVHTAQRRRPFVPSLRLQNARSDAIAYTNSGGSFSQLSA